MHMQNVLILSTRQTLKELKQSKHTQQGMLLTIHDPAVVQQILIPPTAVLCLSVDYNEHVVVRKSLHFHRRSINFF